MSKLFLLAITVGLSLGAVSVAVPVQKSFAAGSPPTRVGECVSSRIQKIGFRLGTPGSGSAVLLANGIPQVSYDQVAAVDNSRAGDPVLTCLVSVPKLDNYCREGDERGRIFKTTNRRTGASWSLPNSAHACGGA